VQIANGRPKVHLGVPLRATPGYSQVAAMRLRVKRMPLPILIPASAFLADDRRLPFVAGDLDADDLVRMVSRRRVQKCSQARQLSRILNRFTGTRRNDRFLRQLLPDPLQRKCTRCIRPRRYRDSGCRTGGGDRKVVSRFERTPKAAEVPHTDRQSVMAPNMLGVERAPFFTLFQSHLSQFVAEPFPQRHTSHVGESGAGFRFDQQACIGTYRLV